MVAEPLVLPPMKLTVTVGFPVPPRTVYWNPASVCPGCSNVVLNQTTSLPMTLDCVGLVETSVAPGGIEPRTAQ